MIVKKPRRRVGEIFIESGDTPPAGALACDSARYPVIDYPRLFGKIDHRYAVDGDDTEDGFFRVPGSPDHQPFFRQAQKVVTPGLDFTPAPDWTNYQNMSGSEGVNYGVDHYEVSEGADVWDYFRASRSGSTSGAWSRYRWTTSAQTSGRFFLPFVWQAKFNSNGNTYHHVGLIKSDMTYLSSLDYGLKIHAQQSGGMRVLTGINAITPGGETNITSALFPLGIPSFAGDTIELSLMLWFDLDAGNWGVQVGQTALTLGAMSAIPGVGLCMSYMINWTGPSDAEGRLHMIHNSALGLEFFGGLSPSVYDVAPIVPPAGYANVFDWPDVVTYATGATGGAVEHQHGGYALSGADLPALDVTTQGYEGSSAPAVDSVAYSATPGAEHAHPAASSLPPYIDVLYCIQAR